MSSSSSSSSASASSAASHSSAKSIANLDPITRNALRYTVSAREYELLHQYLLSRAPVLKRRAPRPAKKQDDAVGRDEDYNAATVRLSVRLFVATYSSLKLWEVISTRLWMSVSPSQNLNARPSTPRFPIFRLSLSLSSILLFHRLIHRFLTRLRASILGTSARSFRRRNPRVATLLTSQLTPPLGAGSISGLFLALTPASQTRVTLAIYTFSRALESLYTHLAALGYFARQPAWLGSWLLVPFATGQLLHAFVFDRGDAFPAGYGSFILKNSPAYTTSRPPHYPLSSRTATTPWPSTDAFVDGLAQISRLRWPAFTSPILFPAASLPASLAALAPLINPAHPSISRLSCAALHPADPSCLRTYLTHWLLTLPRIARFLLLFYSALSLPRLLASLLTKKPSPSTTSFAPHIRALLLRTARTSIFLTGAIGTSWSSICLLQRLLPAPSFLPTARWFLGGFAGGLWAYVLRGSGEGRAQAMYSARASADSLWKVGRKRGWWRGVRGGDVLVFAVGLGVLGAVCEGGAGGGGGGGGGFLGKGLRVMRGLSWSEEEEEEEEEGEVGVVVVGKAERE